MSGLTLSAAIGSSSAALGAVNNGTPRNYIGLQGSNIEEIDWTKVRKRLVDKYGKPEGTIAYNISRNNAQQVIQNEKTKKEGWNDIKEKLQSHPKTDEIAKEITRVERHKNEDVAIADESELQDNAIEVESSSGVSTTTTTDLYLNGSTTDKHSTLNTRVEASVELDSEHLHVLCNSSVAGSGTATARMHSDYSLPTDTTYDISVRYDREIDSYGGGSPGSISVMTEDSFNGLRTFELEDLSTGASGTVTRSASVPMTSDRNYRIGVLLTGASDSIGTPASVFDGYNCINAGCATGRHGVYLPRPPIMRW